MSGELPFWLAALCVVTGGVIGAVILELGAMMWAVLRNRWRGRGK
jgi:hypothetical protein